MPATSFHPPSAPLLILRRGSAWLGICATDFFAAAIPVSCHKQCFYPLSSDDPAHIWWLWLASPWKKTPDLVCPVTDSGCSFRFHRSSLHIVGFLVKKCSQVIGPHHNCCLIPPKGGSRWVSGLKSDSQRSTFANPTINKKKYDNLMISDGLFTMLHHFPSKKTYGGVQLFPSIPIFPSEILRQIWVSFTAFGTVMGSLPRYSKRAWSAKLSTRLDTKILVPTLALGTLKTSVFRKNMGNTHILMVINGDLMVI